MISFLYNYKQEHSEFHLKILANLNSYNYRLITIFMYLEAYFKK